MILLTFGQPKSASTFLAQISRRAAVLASRPQADLYRTYLTQFPQHSGGFWEGALDPLLDVAGRMAAGDIMSIKTHAPPPADAQALARNPHVRVFLSYRDPGDAALSCHDAGAALRAEGSDKQPAFQRLTTHRAAIDFMLAYIEGAVMPWLRSGVGTAYSFDELTNSPDRFLGDLAEAVGLDPARLRQDPAIDLLLTGERRVYNFNKGVSGRAASTFSAEDRAYVADNAGPFIAFCEGRIARADL